MKKFSNLNSNSYSDADWTWEFYEELVDDIEENKNIIACISCGKCVGDCPAADLGGRDRSVYRRLYRHEGSVGRDGGLADRERFRAGR